MFTGLPSSHTCFAWVPMEVSAVGVMVMTGMTVNLTGSDCVMFSLHRSERLERSDSQFSKEKVKTLYYADTLACIYIKTQTQTKTHNTSSRKTRSHAEPKTQTNIHIAHGCKQFGDTHLNVFQ